MVFNYLISIELFKCPSVITKESGESGALNTIGFILDQIREALNCSHIIIMLN